MILNISPKELGKSRRSSFKLKKCGFGNLSAEILINIFRNLDEDDLRANIIPVCQQWRYAAENPILWKALRFSGKRIQTSLICDKIWRYRYLTKICLKNILEPVTVLRQISRCSEDLQHLVLRYCADVSEDALRHLVFTCKNLKTLDLKGTSMKSSIFFEELICAKNLTSINLSANEHLTSSNVLTVAANCRTLDGFHLSSFNPNNRVFLTDRDCYFIIASLVFGLKSISLDCSTLNSYSFSCILRCKKLVYLCLNYAYNFDGSIFETMWKNLPQLTTLKIRNGRQISDLNVKTLFEEGREVMGKLQVIDFTSCYKISDDGVNAIANCCKQLKTLILRSCKYITDLLPVLKNCETMEVLNIAFCESLAIDGPPVPRQLRLLFISDNNDLKMFADLVKKINDESKVKMCVSEFNKRTINYE